MWNKCWNENIKILPYMWKNKMVITDRIRIYSNGAASNDTHPFCYVVDTGSTSTASSDTTSAEWFPWISDTTITYVEELIKPVKVFFQPWKVAPPKEMYRRLQKREFILWAKIFVRRIAKTMKHKSRQYYYRGIK
jgi:hypothetical protein